MKNFRGVVVAAVFVAAGVLWTTGAGAAELKVVWPLGRVAYQTNEMIDVSVVRSDAAALKAGKLALTLASADGARVAASFDVSAGGPRATEHLRVNGRLLRPGNYAVQVTCDGATASSAIEVHSHLRRSSFKLIDWGSRAKAQEQAVLGAQSMGFNLNYAAYGGIDADAMIRGGLDYMRNCTMSGAHQMDIRQECDWTDPYVLQGAEARVVRQALSDRRNPNAVGVHFYDEPGLTWTTDAKTGMLSPYNLPPADRSYRGISGQEPIHFTEVRPDDAQSVRRWKEMNRWKLSVMDAVWKYSQFGVSQVNPNFVSVTQSAYGFSAYADGYYFNVARSLPVLSTHGGYDDYAAGYWNPALTFEFGRMRDYAKPNWYLPTWYGNTPSDRYRMESWLCFMMGLQGLAKPPDMQVHQPFSSVTSAGIVEVNRIAERLGTIFTTMPVDRGDVAVLYSLSSIFEGQIRDLQGAKELNKSAYEGGGHSRDRIMLAYLAGKRIGQNLFPVVEEDVLDGTVASSFKAIFLPGVSALEANVVAALEQYAAGGGLVIVSDDSKVEVKGAVKLGYAMTSEAMQTAQRLYKEDKKAFEKLETTDYYWRAAGPVAEALKARLGEKGIRAALLSDNPYVVTSRQAYGDVEYLFAVNAAFDEKEGKRNSIKGAKATFAFMDTAASRLPKAGDLLPIYDAIHGGQAAAMFYDGDITNLRHLTFGPGQMRAFARTARPIGGVRVATPVVRRELTAVNDPIRVELSASVVDADKGVLVGSIPLEIRVTDPLGVVRFEGYRATDKGVWRMDVPLAANDAGGEWTVSVTELLANTSGTAKFKYQPATSCGAVAGAVVGAISFGNDRENAFRFFRTHRDVTIVVGGSAYDEAAGRRIIEILKPWDVRCEIVKAAEAARPRELTDAERPTWVGLEPGRVGPTAKEPNPKASPAQVGFDARGPVILVGNPDDNAILKFAADKGFLPYASDKDNFPGAGRGMMAWQRDLVSYQSESIALIAYDGAGMNQAVNALYEAASAIDPLMPLAVAAVAVKGPEKSTAPPEGRVAWRAVVPDRPVGMKVEGGAVVVTSNDGSVTTIDAGGKVTAGGRGDAPTDAPPTAPKVDKELAARLLPHRVAKVVAAADAGTAVGYWGGTVQVLEKDGAVRLVRQLPHDVTGMVWRANVLVVGLSDGSVVGVE